MIYFNQIIKLFSSKQFLKMPKRNSINNTKQPRKQPICVGLPNFVNSSMPLIGFPLHAQANILEQRTKQTGSN